MNLFSPSKSSLKALGCGAFVALSLGLASRAGAQTPSYQTNFDNLTPNSTLSGQDNWTDNDTDQPDSVGFVSGYSTSATDYLATVGGAFVAAGPTGGAPTTSPVYLAHPFNPVGGSYTFDADFAVTSSVTGFANSDSFGFTFQGANGNNLFSIDFVPQLATGATTGATVDAIRYSIYNLATGAQSQMTTGMGFQLNSRLHLSLAVNELTNTLSFTVTPNSGPALTETNLSLFGTQSALTAGFAATYVETVAGAPGSNALIFDNVAAVPEPSTYAMLGLGFLGLATRFRRKARA